MPGADSGHQEKRLAEETVRQLGPAYSTEQVTPVLNQAVAVHELAEIPGSETSWTEALGYSDQVIGSSKFFGKFKDWLRKRHPGQEIKEEE